MRRLAVTLALLSLGFTCGPSGPNPTPDSCAAPGSGHPTTLVLGGGDPFTPFTDGQVVELVTGGQGFLMLPVRMKLTGDVPDCLAQSSSLIDSDRGDVGHWEQPLNTYAESDGSRTTKPLYMILGGATVGDEMVVTVAAGGLTASARLFVHAPGVTHDFAVSPELD